MKENWKPIAGYKGIYEISNFGQIKRVAKGPGTKPGTIIKPWIRSEGYSYHDLNKNGKRRHFRTHTLVAKAFIGPPPTKKHQINHIDGNKQNNKVDNLEWVTPSENQRHARDIFGYWLGERGSASKLTPEKVIELRKMYKTGLYSQRELAKIFGIAQSSIWSIIHKITWAHI